MKHALLYISIALFSTTASAIPDPERAPKEQTPTLKRTPIEARWESLDGDLAVVLPAAIIRRKKGAGTQYDAIGISLLIGYGCTSLLPPSGPWTLICGGDKRFYSIQRDAGTNDLKIELLEIQGGS